MASSAVHCGRSRSALLLRGAQNGWKSGRKVEGRRRVVCQLAFGCCSVISLAACLVILFGALIALSREVAGLQRLPLFGAELFAEAPQALVSASSSGEKPKLIPLVAADSGYSENSSVNILCTVSQGHDETLTFDWFKDGQLLPMQQQQQEASALQQQQQLQAMPTSKIDEFGFLPPNLAPQIEKHLDHSLLRISRVQLQHSGRYTCAAKNQFGQDSSSVNLIVNVKLQWTKEPPKEVVVSVNQELKVDCLAQGEPRPSMRWERLSAESSSSPFHSSASRRAGGGSQQSSGGNINTNNNSANGKNQLALGSNGYKLAQQQATAANSANGLTLAPQAQAQSGLLVSSNRYLSIQRAKESDGGIYECIASNSHDADLRKLVHVQVRAPASFEHKFVVIQAKLGDSIRLECNATGDQPISIDWFREGNNETIEKHGNDLYDIHESITDFGLSSFMQIRALKADDGLLYKCLAKNEFGSGERLIKLIVLGVPEKPSQVRVRDVWSRSALVTWMSLYQTNSRVSNYTVQYWRKNPAVSSNGMSASNNNNNHINQALITTTTTQNHRREEILVDGLQSSALLVNLAPALTYEVSVIANNQVGRSEPSETVNVTTSEEEPAAPPTDVQVEARGSSSLRVMWKVPPSESLNGKLLGFYIGYRPRFVSNPAPAATSHHFLQPQLSPNSIQQQQQQQQQQLQVQQQQQQQQLQLQQQSVIYSFKTADAIEGQLYYETFLTNLKHNQDYEVTVRAFNKAGSGPDCHTVAARTNSAKLPQAPNLQVQRVTSSSVTLRWSSTVSLIGGPRLSGANSPITSATITTSGGQQAAGMEILRYVLYYQLQGERDWYELTVGRSGLSGEQEVGLADQVGGQSMQAARSPLVEMMIGGPNGLASELITSHSSVHTLSNLQAGLSYRIYVAAANDYGIGDPSNVVAVKTESLNSSSSASSSSSAYLGAALLDQMAPSAHAGSLFESWGQQQHHGLLYTILSSAALLALLAVLIGYLIWQFRTRHKYNSSSGSSYPSSWTPAASDTIQSEYSVKRFPIVQPTLAAASNSAAAAAALEVYDEVPSSGGSGGRGMRQFASGTSSRALSQQHQLLRNLQTGSAATATRPLQLSSHYHQPADLISNSSTLQLHSTLSAQQNKQSQQHQHLLGRQQLKLTSSTLNRNQNRQLPPIPYSTLSVKEMEGNSSSKQQWRSQQQQATLSSSESYNKNNNRQLCANQQHSGGTSLAPVALHATAKHHKQHQHQHQQHKQQISTGGSQMPLIYGVIE